MNKQKSNEHVTTKSLKYQLSYIRPFDEQGILHSEGRLKFASISQKVELLILLNNKHLLSKLIILNIHENNKQIS